MASSAHQIYRAIKEGRTTLADELKQQTIDFSTLSSIEELMRQDERPNILIALANLHDEGYRPFVQKFSVGVSARLFNLAESRGRFYALSEAQLLQLRNELRDMWRASHGHYLQSWLTFSVPSPSDLDDNDYLIRALRQHIGFPRAPYTPINPSLELGRFVVEARNFPAQLVQAVLENHQYMRVCANPDCTVPYFLAKRSTQKYCEAGVCVHEASKEYKRKWWRETRGANAKTAKKTTRNKATKKGTKKNENKTNRKQR